MSKSIRISDEAYASVVEESGRTRKTVTALVDEWRRVPVRLRGGAGAGTQPTGEEVSPPERSDVAARDPEARCGRCRQPWRLHQSGRFGSRAELTGCTTFEV